MLNEYSFSWRRTNPFENVADSIAVAAVMLFPDVALYHR